MFFRSCWVFAETTHVVGSKWNFACCFCGVVGSPSSRCCDPWQDVWNIGEGEFWILWTRCVYYRSQFVMSFVAYICKQFNRNFTCTGTSSATLVGLLDTVITRAIKHKLHAGCQNHPLWQWQNGPVCCCMTLFAASTFHSIAARGLWSCTARFVPGDLDLWLWHSNSSERGTKRVFHVNLVQIRWAVPKIFDSQTKKQKSHGC